jgi:tryptophan 2,3-dioxygenase
MTTPAPERGAAAAPRRPHFGEQDRQLSYGLYLQVPELLSLQRHASDPPAHDELLFIIVHQAYELWFKQLLFELESVRSAMLEARIPRARHLLHRAHAIERVLIEQVGVIETMSPQDFLEFRMHLAPASGFQSVQFREIEFLSGLKDERYLQRLSTDADELDRLERRLDEPSLWDAFCSLLSRSGLPMPADDEEARRASLVAMARERDRWCDEFELSEALLTHDELFSLWRQRHVLMVERQIGSKAGTGGSTGASYLRTTLDKRFYPELWSLRSYL